MSTSDNLKKHIYTPQQAARIAVEDAKRIAQSRNRVMPFFVDTIKDYFRPLREGMLCVVLAQTHNGKSFVMNKWELEHAKYLELQGRDEIIVHVDVENVIEDQVHGLMRDYGVYDREVLDWDEVKEKFIRASILVGKLPVYRIGVRAGDGDFNKLFLSNVMKMIEYIQGRDPEFSLTGRELKIAAIVVDYLQALPVDPQISRAEHKDQRRLQVRADVFTCRKMAARYRCPVILGVQAKQELGGALGPNMLTPGMYDGMETADIATRTDALLSLWMPVKTHSFGQVLHHSGTEFKVEPELMWMRLNKQRVPGGAPSGKSWPVFINWASSENEVRLGTMLRGGEVYNPYQDMERRYRPG